MARFAAPRMACTAVLVFMLVAAAPHVDAFLTCGQITTLLTPCISYAIVGGTVPPLCCQGIKALNAAKKTTEDHRAACSCIKNGLSAIPGINYDLVNTLPAKCGTTCPYKVTPTTDCSKVN